MDIFLYHNYFLRSQNKASDRQIRELSSDLNSAKDDLRWALYVHYYMLFLPRRMTVGLRLQLKIDRNRIHQIYPLSKLLDPYVDLDISLFAMLCPVMLCVLGSILLNIVSIETNRDSLICREKK